MFEEQHICNVVVKIRRSGKQQNYSIDLQINESSEIDLSTLTAILKSLKAAEENDMIFYFNHVVSHYVKVNDEQPFVNCNTLIQENLISIQIETILSDEVLANPIVEEIYERRNKRNREKTIQEAFLLVTQWRRLYREGTFDQKGALLKMNLDQAAQIVNAPRKTLEDYYLLFRRGLSSDFKFKQFRECKIGTLRSFIKQQSCKQAKQQKKQKFDQQKFFKLLSPSMVDCMKQQQQIFDVLEQGSSDEDILFEN